MRWQVYPNEFKISNLRTIRYDSGFRDVSKDKDCSIYLSESIMRAVDGLRHVGQRNGG